MRVSTAGLNLIKQFEGCKLSAYKCPAGIWTIGYGSTGGVHEGMKIDEPQATEMLRKDVHGAEDAVTRNCKGVRLTQGMFDALVSFVFNLGEGTFKKSTLLKKIRAGDFATCPAEFNRFNKAAGKVLPGLVKRRKAEAALFQSI